MKIRSLPFWLMILYIMIIFGLTSIPGNSLHHLSFLAIHDKIIHYIEYLILGFLFYNALKPEYRSKKGFFISLLFLIVIPVVDENLQRLIPGRFPSYLDGFIDVLGGFSGVFTRSRM